MIEKQENVGVEEEKTYGNDYVWDWLDKNGQLLFTKIPNCLLWAVMDKQITLVETRVLLFICRMTRGFKNQKETRDLGLNEFEKYTFIPKSHLSKTIKGLMKKGFISRRPESGQRHRYSINYSSYGYEGK
jgi:DNA-binding MarR family transcriptional regulator